MEIAKFIEPEEKPQIVIKPISQQAVKPLAEKPLFIPPKVTKVPINLTELYGQLKAAIKPPETVIQDKVEKIKIELRDEIKRCLFEKLK